MEKTPKYQLSQWKEEDRIRREDLNQDNINLESALVGMESRKLELIKVFDITKQWSDSPPWDISLTEMDPKSRTAIFSYVSNAGFYQLRHRPGRWTQWLHLW